MEKKQRVLVFLMIGYFGYIFAQTTLPVLSPKIKMETTKEISRVMAVANFFGLVGNFFVCLFLPQF